MLVVDDSKFMRELLRTILHSLDVKNVSLIGDVPTALQELKLFAADIVITDWHMEPVDGLEFVRTVRTAKDSPNPFIPIIMITGFTELHRVMEARDVGVNEFLSKPFSAKSLYARIASVIERPRLFIRAKNYVGPDRRRRDVGPPEGISERRLERDAVASPA